MNAVVGRECMAGLLRVGAGSGWWVSAEERTIDAYGVWLMQIAYDLSEEIMCTHRDHGGGYICMWWGGVAGFLRVWSGDLDGGCLQSVWLMQKR